MKEKKLSRSFYARPADQVAKDLIGQVLVRRDGRKTNRVRIVETEAYLGSLDLACHAAKGRTPRTEVMFGPPAKAYVYLIYGLYWMFNIVTAKQGEAHAVLIRAAEPSREDPLALSGPGKLTRGLQIRREHNGLDLCSSEIYLLKGTPAREVHVTTRIGINYAKEWAQAPLRFFDADSPAVSKKPDRIMKRICLD